MVERIGSMVFALMSAGAMFVASHDMWPLGIFALIYAFVSVSMWRGAA